MLKRLTAIFAALTLTAGMSCAPVYAAEDEGKLVEVKSKLEIPAELTKLNISTRSNTDGESYTSYEWTSPDDEPYAGSLYVTCDDEAQIISYALYLTDDEGEGAILTADELYAAADEQLRRLIPERFGADDTLVLDEASSTLSLTRGASLTYKREKNGVPVEDNRAYVSVSTERGEAVITDMSLSWDDNAIFDEVKTAEGAEDAYNALTNTELEYHTVYKSSGTIMALQYAVKSAPYMNPETLGEIEKVSYSSDTGRYASYAETASSSAASADTANGLTEEEISALEEIDGLISSDTAFETLKGISELGIDEDDTVTSTRVYKNSLDKYIMSLNMLSGEDGGGYYKYASVNAETGKLYSFNSANKPIYSSKNEALDEDTLDALEASCEEFLTEYADGFSDYTQTAQSASTDGTEVFVNEEYTKLINGVPFTDDTVSVTYSNDTGQIYSLYKSTTELPADIPDPADAVSEDEAWATIYDTYPLTLVYVYDGESYKTAYTIGTSARVDAVANTAVSYNNTPVTSTKRDYTDISGHWAEDIITLFADYGLTFEGEEFRPDEAITTADFIRLAAASSYVGTTAFTYDDERLISYAKNRFGAELDSGTLNETMTREMAAVYLVTAAGFSRVAEMEGIFTCPFADEADIVNIGYAAIAKGLGLIAGDDGFFLPHNAITRAEALTMLYNYVMNV